MSTPSSARAINFDRLWKIVPQDFSLGTHSIHGPSHWRRVESFGLRIAAAIPEVDASVVRLFALFHDSRRQNEHSDPGHGARGAALAFDLYTREYPQLEAAAFEKLITACCWHTHRTHIDDPTIGACFDADRLDLVRIGVIPDARYLNTAVAKTMILEY